MPTNANAYNSRLTDEALEKRFRDTFRSQGGAELVDDLYASGVIVPVVDFTAAAEGSALRADLQVAWDITTGHAEVTNATTTLISNAGFWKIDVTASVATNLAATIAVTDGITSKNIWRIRQNNFSGQGGSNTDDKFVVYLRSGDSLTGSAPASCFLNVSWRQIADVNGNLVNPSGFTFS